MKTEPQQVAIGDIIEVCLIQAPSGKWRPARIDRYLEGWPMPKLPVWQDARMKAPFAVAVATEEPDFEILIRAVDCGHSWRKPEKEAAT